MVPASKIDTKARIENQLISGNTATPLPPGWTITGNFNALNEQDSQEIVLFESQGSTDPSIIENAKSGDKKAIQKALTRRIILKRTGDEGTLSLFVHTRDLTGCGSAPITWLKNKVTSGIEWPTLLLLSVAEEERTPVLNFLNNIGPNVNEYEFWGFKVGRMKSYLLSHFWEDLLVKVGLFSMSEAHYFKSISLSKCRESSQDEQENLILMNKAIEAGDIASAFQFTKKIHRIVIEENQKNLVIRVHYPDCADDANAGVILGEVLMRSHPLEAYRAFELIPEGSPFYPVAVARMADLSIGCYLLLEQTDSKVAREFLHNALKHHANFYSQTKNEGSLWVLNNLLEIYCSGGMNRQPVLNTNLFTNPDVEFSTEAFDIILAMADIIFAQRRAIENLNGENNTISINARTEIQTSSLNARVFTPLANAVTASTAVPAMSAKARDTTNQKQAPSQ